MAPNYLNRRNAMTKIYHQGIPLKLRLFQNEITQHLYQPKTLLQNNRYRLYWDATLKTDKSDAHNQPDITIFDANEEFCLLIDVTVRQRFKIC